MKGQKVRFKQTQIIALANQKGGCGKTTSSIAIAAAFNQMGYSVAIVDIDPQCNATESFGISPTDLYRQGRLSILDGYIKKRSQSISKLALILRGLTISYL